MPFDFDSIRDLMKCVKCGSSLGIENNQLVCENEDCRQTYPIRDDIPRLLAEDEKPGKESTSH